MVSMGIVIISGLATACILTAIEGLIKPMGKWRGLAAFAISILACYNLDTKLSYLAVYSLATSFIGLTLSLLVEQIFSGPTLRERRGLPNKVGKL